MPRSGLLGRPSINLLLLSLYFTSTTVLCACPSQWQEQDNECFKVYNVRKKWKDASQACDDENAHLIYLDNGRQPTFVDSLTNISSGSEYFVGAKKEGITWNWGNGSQVSLSLLLFLKNGDYAVLKKWDNTFYGVDGNHESNFICELNEIHISDSPSTVTSFTLAATSPLSSSTSSVTLLPSSSSSSELSPSPSPSSSSLPSSSLSSSTSSRRVPSTLALQSSLSSTPSLPPSLSSSSTPSLPSSLSSSSTSLQLSPTPVLTSSASIAQLSLSSASSVTVDNSENNRSTLVAAFIQNITKLDFKEPSSLKDSVELMQNMLVAMVTLNTDSTNQNPLLASQKLEEFALRYTEYQFNDTEVLLTTNNVVLHAKMILKESSDYIFEIQDGENQNTKIVLPKENFGQKGTSVVSIYYDNLEDIMKKEDTKNNRYELMSNILSTSVQPKRNKLAKNATIGFKVPYTGTRLDRRCVFWNFSKEEGKDPGWSSYGCTVTRSTDEYVECSCNHLTHFAVLMQVKDDQLPNDHQDILEILTYIGLTMSITGCVMTFMAYSLFTDVKSEQSQIRMNLVFVLAVAHILFLLASAAQGHIFLCISVAALLQLFYTSALCWMFAEGIQLYMQVIKVFNTNLKMRQVYGFAWGFPIFLIIVSLSIAGNGSGGLSSFVNEKFCWLSAENHLIWTFVGPVLLLILGNMVILGLVIKELKNINKSMGVSHRVNALRASVKAFVVLAPLLGITWLMGLLCILGAGVAGLYVFTILNSTQGFFIFLFHCVRNSEIRSKLQRKVLALEDSQLKQEANGRSIAIHAIKSVTSNKPSTKGNTLKVPQENMALSDLDVSDSVDEPVSQVHTSKIKLKLPTDDKSFTI